MASTRAFDPFNGVAVSLPPQAMSVRPPDAEWYVAEGDYEVGPLTYDDLEARWRSGDLTEQTLVWRMGMEQWQAVDNVDDLSYLSVDLAQDTIEVITPAPVSNQRTRARASVPSSIVTRVI